jgi:adenine deaminase
MYDLILKEGQMIDVRSKRIFKGEILIKDGVIVGIESGSNKNARKTLDLSGQYVSPGFIESHLHIESSLLNPVEFSKEAVKHGTTAIFVDPHEIANVSGRKGIELFLNQSDLLPLDMFIGIPSCVPATSLESAGASISVEDVKELISDRRVYGLAEMMNFPGIIHGFGDAREKVEIAFNAGKVVDGHCPGVSGEDLRKYITNGHNDNVVRISSDHESTQLDEVIEKHNLGMHLCLRYGSATKDMERILPGLIKAKFNLERFMLCSDDLDSADLCEKGHVDRIIKRARDIICENSTKSLEEATLIAISLAAINPARYFSKALKLNSYPEMGEIAAGRRANIVVLDSLEGLEVDKVIHNGTLVVDNKKYVGRHLDYDYSELLGKVNIGRKFLSNDFKIKVPGEKSHLDVRVIEIIKGSIVTKQSILPFAAYRHELRADPQKDLAKIAVIERHKGTGAFSVGFVKGLGLKRGAIASTVAHDSHNLIVAGVEDECLAKAVNYLAQEGGGIVVVADRISYLPLKIAGLMSTESAESVVKKHEALKDAVKEIGSGLETALMTMSFLALPVIPELRITDKGLVDVNKFKIVSLY